MDKVRRHALLVLVALALGLLVFLVLDRLNGKPQEAPPLPRLVTEPARTITGAPWGSRTGGVLLFRIDIGVGRGRAGRRTFYVGDPIVVSCALINEGSSPVNCYPLDPSRVVFFWNAHRYDEGDEADVEEGYLVHQRLCRIHEPDSGAIANGRPEEMTVLGPGERIEGAITINDEWQGWRLRETELYLDRPGIYWFQARYFDAKHGGDGLASNTVMVYIESGRPRARGQLPP